MVFTRAAAMAFASSAALAVVLASSLAVADGTTDSDGDGVPDDLEAATQRTVAVSTAGDEFSVSRHRGTAPEEDELDLSYHAGGLDLWYRQTGRSAGADGLEVPTLAACADGHAHG